MIILCAAAAMAAWCVWGAPDLINAVDYQHLHHFYRGYLKAMVSSGEWWWWNPHVALGRPFVGDPEAAVFYPPTWLWVFMPERWALWAALSLHVAFCGIGVRRLVRYWGGGPWDSLCVGLAFCMCQPFFASAAGGLIGYVFVLSYWPWWLRWSEQLGRDFCKFTFIRLTAAVALGFLAGHPHAFWLIGLATALYLVGVGASGMWVCASRQVGRNLLFFGAACLGGLALGAVQLLPMLELGEQGNRLGMSRAFAAHGPINPEDFIGFLAPKYYSEWSLWVSSLHLGWSALLAVPIAFTRIAEPRVRALILVALGCLVLGLGEHTPVFDFIYPFIPGFGGFRFVGRFAGIGVMALLLLVSFTLHRESNARGARFVLGFVWACWAVGVAWGLLGDVPGSRVWLLVCLAIMGCVLCLYCGRASRAWSKYLWGGFLAVELTIATVIVVRPFSRIHAAGVYNPPAELAARIKENRGPPLRIMAHQQAIPSNAGMRHGYVNVFGNVALTPQRVWFYLHIAAGVVPSRFQLTYFSAEVQDMDFLALPGANVAGAIRRDGRFVPNPTPGARAWLARNYDLAEPGLDLWESLLRPGRPDFLTILESPPPIKITNASAGVEKDDSVRIDHYSPDRIELSVDAAAPALLIVSEAWYPGWTAYVGEELREVVPVNGWMRGIWLEDRGKQRVTLVYRPTNFIFAAMISILTGVLGVLFWVKKRA